MADIQTTTRAYTLKLSGDDDSRWRERLWNTHLTVNRGAQVWGDWLLTLRGALPASLADDPELTPVRETDVASERKRRELAKEISDESIRADLESRRIQNLRVVLALSWLSVESPASLVPPSHIVASGQEDDDDRKRKVMARFHQILTRLQIVDPAEWVAACEPARVCEMPPASLSDIRAKLDKHVKNTYLKKVQAPVGVKPVLKAWMELN